MKSKLQLLCMCLLVFLVSCTNEIEKPIASDDFQESGFTELDLTKSLSDFVQLKSDLIKSNKIRLITPTFERNLIDVTKDDGIVSDESICLKTSNDSISIMIGDACITIISHVTSTEYYLLHESEEFIQDYSRSLLTQTKKEDGVITRQASKNCIVLTGLNSQTNSSDVLTGDDKPLTPADESVLTKGVWPDRWRDVVRIWLIRHSGFAVMQHEVNWQQQHAVTMMRSVNPQVKIEFYTRFSNFRAGYNAYETLDRFKEWLNIHKNRGHEWSGSVGKDIFVLISHTGYGNISGLAYLNVYEKRRQLNPSAIAVSAVNPITSDMTLGHEIGHLLGARHTDYTWWERWPLGGGIWKRDIMTTGDHIIMRSPECRDPNNVRTVRESLR